MAQATPQEVKRYKLALAINGSATDAKNARLSSVEVLKDGSMCMYIHVAGRMIYATIDKDEVDNLIDEEL